VQILILLQRSVANEEERFPLHSWNVAVRIRNRSKSEEAHLKENDFIRANDLTKFVEKRFNLAYVRDQSVDNLRPRLISSKCCEKRRIPNGVGMERRTL